MTAFPLRLTCLAFILWTFSPAGARACLWLHGTTIEGKKYEGSRSDPADVLRNIINQRPENRENYFKLHQYDPEDPIAQLNDHAVQVLLKGNPEKAVRMLEDIEKQHPGVYFTAANLGTAFELSGDDESALRWILEGIKRNPASHMHTEWLHARILETKIKLKEDPQWLEYNTITGADFARLRDPKYAFKTRQRLVDAKDLHKSLEAQLSVRMLFVKPRDPIVAQLLYEFAIVEAYSGALEPAVKLLKLSRSYGYSKEKINPLKKEWQQTIKWGGIKQSSMPWVLVVVFFTGSIFAFRWFIRRIDS